MTRGATRLVAKQRGKKIGPSLADGILAAMGKVPPLLGPLTP
jgi:hypothetical protein